MGWKYYPVCLDVRGKNCIVVGGGDVGARKVATLFDCGAIVKVVSMNFSSACKKFQSKGVSLITKEYRSEDLDDMFLVIGATDNTDVNKKISEDAEKKNMLCNIADYPQACNFILPAVVRRGDLIITASTSGKSPAFAKKLKKELENQFGQEYADFLFLMGKIREKLLQQNHAPEEHKPMFEEIINRGILSLVADKNYTEIDNLLSSVFGREYSYKNLVPGEKYEGAK